MAKFHINNKGEAGRCRAVSRCPFGSVEDHHPTEEDARVAYEMGAKHLKSEVERTSGVLFAKEADLGKISAQKDAVRKRIVEGRSKSLEGDYVVLEALERKYHQRVAAVRRAFQAHNLAWHRARAQGLVSEKSKKSPHTKEYRAQNQKTRRTLDLQATFADRSPAYHASAVEELAAWGGMSYAEAEGKLAAYPAYVAQEVAEGRKPLDEDAYVVTLFQTLGREDLLIAAVDLETTGLHPTTSEIVEIGIVVRNAKGEVVEVIDERFDVENPEYREEVGVGPTEIHKIKPEDVAGLKPFSHPEVQERVGRVLNDRSVVLLAHNSSFERMYLNHYLAGFEQVRERHSVTNLREGRDPGPFIDTRALSGFLLHSTPNNKLESFVRANGVPYEDSHSALPDALMSLRAFEHFRRAVASAPLGERPQLSLQGEAS